MLCTIEFREEKVHQDVMPRHNTSCRMLCATYVTRHQIEDESREKASKNVTPRRALRHAAPEDLENRSKPKEERTPDAVDASTDTNGRHSARRRQIRRKKSTPPRSLDASNESSTQHPRKKNDGNPTTAVETSDRSRWISTAFNGS